MKKLSLVSRVLVGAVLFGSGLGVGLMAQSGGDLQLRKELRRTDLTGAPNMEVIVSMTEIKPGEGIPAHFHNGVEALYVVQGSTIQLPGKDPTQMATGANGLISPAPCLAVTLPPRRAPQRVGLLLRSTRSPGGF